MYYEVSMALLYGVIVWRYCIRMRYSTMIRNTAQHLIAKLFVIIKLQTMQIVMYS
jgi:hypothetical protein